MAILTEAPQRPAPPSELAPETIAFYREAMAAFDDAGVPFLVGGAYAFAPYTGIVRHTKDFDVFVLPGDFDRALDAFDRRGWQTQRTFSHWLGKGHQSGDFVDVIFSSGNGVARVDEEWFEHAVDGEVLGRAVKLVPAEEMIWSKSFIMERERFDGGDVSHVFRCRARELDWDRLLRRFDADGGWRVLLAHLTLFGYIYPGDAHLVPRRVMDALAERLRQEVQAPPKNEKICRGTILSRSQYLIDVHRWRYQDARREPLGNLSAEQIELWTAAAAEDGDVTQHNVLEEG